MEQFNLLVLSFFLYSLIGQIWEFSLSKVLGGKWYYSGFLHLPIIPLYGVSAIMMISAASFFQNDPMTIFIFSVIAITFVEYFTSLILEKVFKRTWWDYRETSLEIVRKFQFEGRISLVVSLVWGVLALVVVYIIQPNVAHLANEVFLQFGFHISLVLLILLVIDSIISSIRHTHKKKLNMKNLTKGKNENSRN